jgi:hypothetical protein
MDNNLIVNNSSELVNVIEQNGISDVIKPLVNEIHLFDSFVAGTSYIEDKSLIEALEVGEKLNLRREDNKFDSNAILIITETGNKIGYVPEKDNQIFARLMDAGKLLQAKISNIKKKGSFTQIAIGIYLVDF